MKPTLDTLNAQEEQELLSNLVRTPLDSFIVGFVPKKKLVPKKKKEYPMYADDYDYDCDCNPCTPSDAPKRNYLLQRLDSINSAKYSEARRTFGLSDDESPKTIKDLIERLKAGKFQADEKEMYCEYYHPAEYIRWRDPNVKEDRAGFKAYEKALKTAFVEVEDAIRLKDPTEALVTLKEFETKTIS